MKLVRIFMIGMHVYIIYTHTYIIHGRLYNTKVRAESRLNNSKSYLLCMCSVATT